MIFLLLGYELPDCFGEEGSIWLRPDHRTSRYVLNPNSRQTLPSPPGQGWPRGDTNVLEQRHEQLQRAAGALRQSGPLARDGLAVRQQLDV